MSEEIYQPAFSKAALERIVLSFSICLSLFLLIAGFYLARNKFDPHWVNRSGAAITAVEGVIAILEFYRQKRLEKIRHYFQNQSVIDSSAKKNTEFIEAELGKSEFQVLAVAILLAAIGELLHGFGDLLFILIFGGNH